MLLIIGFVIVTGATLGGFIIAGGNPMVLLHVSEFVIIGGIALGIMVVSTPLDVMQNLIKSILSLLKGGGLSRNEIIELMKLLYELFVLGRRNGLIALDEHVSEPGTSSLFSKYPTVSGQPERLEFLCNSLKPIVDGKVKPDQIQTILNTSLHSMEEEMDKPVGILQLVGDSLPGVGIIAAVLGIINTMAAISDGPEAVGQKVAAALTGTFLGILGAYGFVNPMTKRIESMNEEKLLYFKIIASSVSSFAKGLAPLMALEIARRGLGSHLQPDSDELERLLKETGGGS